MQWLPLLEVRLRSLEPIVRATVRNPFRDRDIDFLTEALGDGLAAAVLYDNAAAFYRVPESRPRMP